MVATGVKQRPAQAETAAARAAFEHELRDPAFMQGLREFEEGKVDRLELPDMTPEERERRKQQFFESQAKAFPE